MSTHIDYETAGRVDLNKLGAYRYSDDPSLLILMFGICVDDGNVVLWDHTDPDCPESREAKALLEDSVDCGETMYAFNAPFEVAISKYNMKSQLGVDPPKLDNWRCVLAMANRAQLPTGLKDLAKTLKMKQLKDEAGTDLLSIFSKMCSKGHIVTLECPPDDPRYRDTSKSERGKKLPNRKSLNPILGWDEGTQEEILDGSAAHHDEILWDWFVTVKGEKKTVREAWEMTKEYCRQDVRVERDIHERLKAFELRGKILESFLFNLHMNDRGIPVDMAGLKHANALVRQYQDFNAKKFRNITGLNVTQTIKFGDWLRERGYWAENLQADTVADALEIGDDVLTPEAYQALYLYSMMSYAVLKKLITMEAAACSDGRVRGTMLWHGARTGRATGKIIQPQNMKKATMKTEVAMEMILDGCSLQELDELWESPLEVIASCARHFIHVPGEYFNDADYKGVEARIAPWVVGAQGKLDSILAGEDQYIVQAAKIFGIGYDEVEKWQRTIGKPVELSCQFGTGARGLQNALRDQYGVTLPLKECKRIVDVFRADNPEMCDRKTGAWHVIEEAAKDAILNKKTTVILDGKVTIRRGRAGGIPYLIIQLPSGRGLHYPYPRIKKVWKKYTKAEMKEEPWKAERKGYEIDEIQFFGRDQMTKQWKFIGTWGSRLFENIVQAIGADLLDEGCINAARLGYEIFMIVHDQALCPNSGMVGEVEDYCAALCGVGDWARTFPLEADGDVAPYYRKED